MICLTQLLPVHATIAATIHARCFTNSRTWDTYTISTLLEIPGIFGWLAVLQNKNSKFHNNIVKDSPVVGLIIFHRVINEIELLTLGVVPEVRRQGVGSTLIRSIQSSEKIVIFLEVSIDNTEAITLYYKLGFRKIGKRLNYYLKPDGTSIDAFIMKFSM